MNEKEVKEDLVGLIIDFEGGELSANGVLRLFSRLVSTGQAYQLQGSYGRTAHSLICDGWLSTTGEILKRVDE